MDRRERRASLSTIVSRLLIVGLLVVAPFFAGYKVRDIRGGGDRERGNDIPAGATSCAQAEPRTLNLGKEVRWAAVGDSYSAGVGGPLSGQLWGQDVYNSAPVNAAKRFRDAQGLGDEFMFGACSGAKVREQIGDLTALSTQAAIDDRTLGSPQWWDTAPRSLRALRDAHIASVTLGGNDVGFSSVGKDCVVGRCQMIADGGPGGDIPGGSAEERWQVLESRLTDAYVVIRRAMRPDGWLFVLDYPIPFDNPLSRAPCGIRSTVGATDMKLLNRFAGRLDLAVANAVTAARGVLSAAAERPPNVVLVPWRSTLERGSARPTVRTTIGEVPFDVPFNSQGLCGTDPMILDFGPRTRLRAAEDTLHPSQEGVRIGACRLARAVHETLLKERGFEFDDNGCG